MKAMVLAAGTGSRLGEITREIPKCLVEVHGQTMLERVLRRLLAAGITEVAINLFHHARLVQRYLRENDFFGLQIEFSHEEQLLDTGGGLWALRPFFSGCGHFLLHNCDVYSEIDLNALLAAQRRQDCLAVMAVSRRQSSRYLLFDDHDQLSGWKSLRTGEEYLARDIPSVQPLAFHGIHAVSERVFNYMSDMPPTFSIITTYMKAAQAGESIKAYRCDNDYWMDIGAPERLEELRRHLQERDNAEPG